jgi:hypothetical protein
MELPPEAHCTQRSGYFDMALTFFAVIVIIVKRKSKAVGA